MLLGVPQQNLGALFQRGEHGHGREFGVQVEALVGVDLTEQDVGILVEHRHRGLVTHVRTAHPHFEVDAGRPERADVGTLVDVDGALCADQLVEVTALGLGEPPGLDHHRLGADAGQVGGVGGCRPVVGRGRLGGLIGR